MVWALARTVTSCLDLVAAAAAMYTGWAMAEAGLEEQASGLMTNAGGSLEWPIEVVGRCRGRPRAMADSRLMIGLIGGTLAMVQAVAAHTMAMGETLYVLQLQSYSVEDAPQLKSKGVISKTGDNRKDVGVLWWFCMCTW